MKYRTHDTSPFGRLLKERRIANGLTQEALAERAGLGVRTIKGIEQGAYHRPRADTLVRLITALELSPDQEDALRSALHGGESTQTDNADLASGSLTRTATMLSDTRPMMLLLTPDRSPLIGRGVFIHDALAILFERTTRLLTLVGPPGAGKTRIGLEMAKRVADESAQRYDRLESHTIEDRKDRVIESVESIALAPIHQPSLVLSVIAQAVGIPEANGLTLLDTLAAALRGVRTLLFLDNFEHLLDARQDMVSLLARCPDVKILITSRSPLRVQGEHIVTVPPLALPGREMATRTDFSNQADGVDAADLAALSRVEAIALFLRRARQIAPDFALTAENAAAIVRICQRLDGLPLAIELAVARLPMFSAQELAARLEHRLPVLTAGAQDLPARQQTLRNTLDWSYRLLRPEQQALFRALAVFAGGCSWDGIQAMGQAMSNALAQDDPVDPVAEEALVAQVACLLDHHLLERTETKEGVSRYWLLETIREFAQEMLMQSGEVPRAERAHAGYYLARVEAIEPLLQGREQREWLAWLDMEHNNVRAALAWTLRQREGELALRLAGALGWFWYSQGYLREGARWLEHALAVPEPPEPLESIEVSAPPAGGVAQAASATHGDDAPERVSPTHWRALRAKALHAAALLACYQGDYPSARALNEEALGLRRALGDLRGMARTINNLALVLARQGDFAGAATRYEESLALKRQSGEVASLATTLANLGMAYVDDGDYANARRVYEGCLEQWRRQGDDYQVARTLANLAEIALREGQDARAAALLDESLTLRHALGDKMGLANTIHLLGALAYSRGDAAQAFTCYRESCGILLAVGGDMRALVLNLEALAPLFCTEWEVERAVWLSSAAATLRARLPTHAKPFEQEAIERTLALEHAALDDASFARAWDKGAVMTVEEVWKAIRTSAISARSAKHHMTSPR